MRMRGRLKLAEDRTQWQVSVTNCEEHSGSITTVL